ncbi:MAG: VIT domain-containing protein, partial [Limisphaerales bacterium]
TILFEVFTKMCAGVFFDPLPSTLHLLLVSVVPLANFTIWKMLREGDLRFSKALGWASGVVIGICLFYSLLFLPMSPFAVIGIIFYGFGLLPLTPLLALIAAIFLRLHLRRQLAPMSIKAPGLWLGMFLGFVALVVAEIPEAMTRISMQWAASTDRDERGRGIRWLRAIGNEDSILRACYTGTRRNELSLINFFSGHVSSEEARTIYFRVTGRAFNAVPPPKLFSGPGRAWTEVEDEFIWDSGLGGEAVAGRVKGLSLSSSRLDGVVEADGGLAYIEWTMEFHNVSPRQQEARAQILLPPGAVVSRLTLWVNGEEREAAFAGRSHVREAYQKVAVQQRRDPVLVTTSGPDRVLMQCFPIPENGGKMKIRIGVTVPLSIRDSETALLQCPTFLERNFNIPENVLHSVWLEGEGKVEADRELNLSINDRSARGEVAEAVLGKPQAALLVRHSFPKETRYVADEGEIVQRLITEQQPSPKRLALVLDSSIGMRGYLPEIKEALAKLPETIEVTLLYADEEQVFERHFKTLATDRQEFLKELGKIRTVGGQNNLLPLTRACDLVADDPGAQILWIHGPQPVTIGDIAPLEQFFARRPIRLQEIQTSRGPNRIVEKLDAFAGVSSIARFGSLGEDLQRTFDTWGGAPRFRYARVIMTEQTDAKAQRGSKHIARLWAAERIAALRSEKKFSDAIALAAKYQLVTPVSGAVVLETQQQYADSGLVPVDPSSVPTVPEPSTYALLGFGMALVWWFRIWSRRQKASEA